MARYVGEVSVMPVCDESGRCYQLVGVVHDLTKEKRAEGFSNAICISQSARKALDKLLIQVRENLVP
jgi:hypothetical protein